MTSNPYDIPGDPKVTMKDILSWIASQQMRGGATGLCMSQVADQFGMTHSDAAHRLNKYLHWGYLKRRKAEIDGRRMYEYYPSRFGLASVKKWKGKR